MSEVSASVMVSASLAEVWDAYFDPARWPSWSDGFASVLANDDFPSEGGTLRWRSTPAGRGEVTERVIDHRPRGLHRVAFTDPQTEGELAATFAIEGERARVTQDLRYELRSGGPFAWATDRLFIRSQQRGSLERSLEALRREVEAVA